MRILGLFSCAIGVFAGCSSISVPRATTQHALVAGDHQVLPERPRSEMQSREAPTAMQDVIELHTVATSSPAEKVGWGSGAASDGSSDLLTAYVRPPESQLFRYQEPEVLEPRFAGDLRGSDTWCPLLLSFDGAAPQFAPVHDHGFDARAPTGCAGFDWPTAKTPWLVHDVDGNEIVDGGHELLGASTRLPSGEIARDGFEAIAALDDDGDGALTPKDAAWGSLLLWFDRNGDGRSVQSELVSLERMGVRAIPVRPTGRTGVCDGRGNCLADHAPIESSAGLGMLIDVELRCSQS